MLLNKAKILRSHGWQYISKLNRAELPEIFRGLPRITDGADPKRAAALVRLCPTKAIKYTEERLYIDLGRCLFCNECALVAPEHVVFTNEHRIASSSREGLIVSGETAEMLDFDESAIRKEVTRYFGRAMKLRQVSAGGDNSTELELSAVMNVNFDFSRFGIDFVASPRHADGLVITGPITENMNEALEICYNAMARPKLIILAGTDAISGGLFASSPAIKRTFLEHYTPDLYIPGNPVHPLTFIDGVMKLLDRKFRR